MSSGPKTATPPPNAARGATADLCDIYITDPVDVVSQRNVQIMEPIFRSLIYTTLSPNDLGCPSHENNSANAGMHQHSAEHDTASETNPS